MVDINTLTTDVWDEVYTYLQSTNPISTDNIFSAMNSALVKNKGYPLVIIYPPYSGIDKMNITGSGIISEIIINIEIYHNSSQNVKSLKDEIVAKMLVGRNTFSSAGLQRMKFGGGSYDTWEENKKKVHRLAIDVTFTYIGL